MRCLAAIAVFLAACGGKETSPTSGPAGEVLRVEGAVTATRAAEGSQPRVLAVSADVFADDTVATDAGGSVDIRLAHNEAVWKLGPGETRRVDASAAWRAPKGSSEASAFASTDQDRTASAGRHTDMAFDEGKMGKRSPKPERPKPARGVKGTGSGSGTGYGAGSGSRGGGGGKPKLQTRIGAATVDGALDKDVIRRVMRSRFPALKRCYEHELEQDPKFTAEVTALFTVEKAGRLSPITVDPDVSPTFTACLKAAIRAVRMPTADAETEVSLPLVFTK